MITPGCLKWPLLRLAPLSSQNHQLLWRVWPSARVAIWCWTKCGFTDGSFKRAKKGYEGIHIPAPKQKPPVEASLDWSLTSAWDVFTVPNLNVIQSKLYPIAVGRDEPILCAPTGAGWVSDTAHKRFHTILIVFLVFLDQCSHAQDGETLWWSYQKLRIGPIQDRLHCADEGSCSRNGWKFQSISTTSASKSASSLETFKWPSSKSQRPKLSPLLRNGTSLRTTAWSRWRNMCN